MSTDGKLGYVEVPHILGEYGYETQLLWVVVLDQDGDEYRVGTKDGEDFWIKKDMFHVEQNKNGRTK